jgi:hypothetical protein
MVTLETPPPVGGHGRSCGRIWRAARAARTCLQNVVDTRSRQALDPPRHERGTAHPALGPATLPGCCRSAKYKSRAQPQFPPPQPAGNPPFSERRELASPDVDTHLALAAPPPILLVEPQQIAVGSSRAPIAPHRVGSPGPSQVGPETLAAAGAGRGSARAWGGPPKANAAQRSAAFREDPTGRASASVPAATPAPPRRIDHASDSPPRTAWTSLTRAPPRPSVPPPKALPRILPPISRGAFGTPAAC